MEAVLIDYDSAVRHDFPGDAPALDIACAFWAARQFYLACKFAVYRDLPAEAMAQAFDEACPIASPAVRHYSVDLVFRFLPDLYRLARTASSEDPLCLQLLRWAGDWPLSSVGMSDANPSDLGPILEHRGLRKLYADRIVAREDLRRLNFPEVRAAVRAALGAFEDLAPAVAAASREPAASATASPTSTA